MGVFHQYEEFISSQQGGLKANALVFRCYLAFWDPSFLILESFLILPLLDAYIVLNRNRTSNVEWREL